MNDEEQLIEEELEEELDNDEINDAEEGFIEGYEKGENIDSCLNCGQQIFKTDFTEIEIEGKICRFCCQECADDYIKRKKEI